MLINAHKWGHNTLHFRCETVKLRANINIRANSMQAAPSGHTAVILVVDDEPCVLDTICLVLAHAGYKVLGASGPADALAIAAQPHNRLNLLLTDVVMPHQHGPDLAAGILNLQPGARVLFMAGMPDTPEIRDRVAGCGFDFLPKPFLPSTLLAAVAQVLRQERGQELAAAF
jgi:two-component system, cell cycle sensor histidine kinase and response regulator CckA